MPDIKQKKLNLRPNLATIAETISTDEEVQKFATDLYKVAYEEMPKKGCVLRLTVPSFEMLSVPDQQRYLIFAQIVFNLVKKGKGNG